MTPISDVSIRRTTLEDVERCVEVSHLSFGEMLVAHGREPRPLDDERQTSQRERFAHFVQQDPDGCWLAERHGEIIGHAQALRRDGYWGLSQLAVVPASQSTGVGKLLLDATLDYAEGCARQLILSSPDPRALRRYATAGFTLHPTMTAKGTVDHARMPADLGVRDYRDGDAALLDEVATVARGAPLAPDAVFVPQRSPVLVDATGNGFTVLGTTWYSGPAMLAATDEATARRLLWAALAQVPDGEPATVQWLTATHGWAVEVCLDARLSLRSEAAAFHRGYDPPTLYLPNGAFL